MKKNTCRAYLASGERCTRAPTLDGYCLIHFSSIQKTINNIHSLKKQLKITNGEYKKNELKRKINHFKKKLENGRDGKRQNKGNKIPKKVWHYSWEKNPPGLDRTCSDYLER